MADKQRLHNQIVGLSFPATEALAANKRNEGIRQGFVEVSSMLLVDDLRKEASAPDLFPRIEWSRFEIHGQASPAERFRRLLIQRVRKGSSAGLMRSIRLLCLPSADRELELLVRKEQRNMRRGSSSSRLSAAASKKRNSLALASTPLPTHQPECIKKREDSSNYSPFSCLYSSQQYIHSRVKQAPAEQPTAIAALSQGAQSASNEQQLLNSLKQAAAEQPTAISALYHGAQSVSNEQHLLSSLLQDFPFPDCP